MAGSHRNCSALAYPLISRAKKRHFLVAGVLNPETRVDPKRTVVYFHARVSSSSKAATID